MTEEEIQAKKKRTLAQKNSLIAAAATLQSIVTSNSGLLIIEIINHKKYHQTPTIWVVTDQDDIIIRYIMISGVKQIVDTNTYPHAHHQKIWANDSRGQPFVPTGQTRQLYENGMLPIIQSVN